MTTTELKRKIYAAIEQNNCGELSTEDAIKVLHHIYGCIQEISDAVPSFEECGDMTHKSNAHLDRFEAHQTLRSVGIDVEY